MDIVDLLESRGAGILGSAGTALKRAHLEHYELDGPDATFRYLRGLYSIVTDCVRNMEVIPVITHAEKVAQERYFSGYGLSEVQTAFNVLEEAIWQSVLQELDPTDYARALGLVGTVLGMGKDALARKWVFLASRKNPDSLDCKSLFRGCESA